MTLQSPQVFLPRLKEIFSKCGVTFVLLPYLKNSGVNGAVKWINKDKVILALNDRRKSADTFWFSLFHEIKHVLQQKHKQIFISGQEINTAYLNEQLEAEADKFAQETLIPEKLYQAFINNRNFSDPAPQIRHDFNSFGGFGQQGYGYNVPELQKRIGEILCVDKELKTILIGAGNLGKAVSNKIFIRQSGFKLIGIFDKNEAICGNMIKGIPVRHINYLENFCIDNQPVCAVICIPGSDMQEITDMLVRLGVRAFWNFSNYDIAMAHPEVLVENVHLNDSLMTLGYLTNTSLAEDEAR